MKHYIKDNKYLIFTVLWMAVIFLFSSQNGQASNLNNVFIANLLKKIGIDSSLMALDINFFIRKSAHFTEYFILGLLLFKTYTEYLYRNVKRVSAVTGFLYACSDEIHQHFVPGRAASYKDVLIDTSGVVIGILIIFLIYSIRNRERKIYRPL